MEVAEQYWLEWTHFTCTLIMLCGQGLSAQSDIQMISAVLDSETLANTANPIWMSLVLSI